VEYFRPEGPPSDLELHENYDRIALKTGNSAYVLAMIQKSKDELLSRSTSVIASQGQKKKGRKLWFTMVAFDENGLAARRKYLFIVNDRPNLMEEPKKDLSFDCEVVMESEVPDKPYANENARRIATLRQVQEKLRKDTDQVGSDNKMLDICGMLTHQALEAVLVELDSSPAMASGLSTPGGVDFSHVNLGRGKIQMLSELDIIKIKMRLGKPVKEWIKDLEASEKERKRQELLAPKTY